MPLYYVSGCCRPPPRSPTTQQACSVCDHIRSRVWLFRSHSCPWPLFSQMWLLPVNRSLLQWLPSSCATRCVRVLREPQPALQTRVLLLLQTPATRVAAKAELINFIFRVSSRAPPPSLRRLHLPHAASAPCRHAARRATSWAATRARTWTWSKRCLLPASPPYTRARMRPPRPPAPRAQSTELSMLLASENDASPLELPTPTAGGSAAKAQAARAKAQRFREAYASWWTTLMKQAPLQVRTTGGEAFVSIPRLIPPSSCACSSSSHPALPASPAATGTSWTSAWTCSCRCASTMGAEPTPLRPILSHGYPCSSRQPPCAPCATRAPTPPCTCARRWCSGAWISAAPTPTRRHAPPGAPLPACQYLSSRPPLPA